MVLLVPWWRILAILLVVAALGFLLRWLGRIASRSKVMTRDQVAVVLETFINRATQGTEMRPVADASWVDFITTAIADPELDQIRERCLNLDSEFPPLRRGEYCSPDGVAVLRDITGRLRSRN